MSVVGVSDCACHDFRGSSMPFHGPPAVWLVGQAGIRKALKLLQNYGKEWFNACNDQGDQLYHGGVHVDGIHVTAILDDDGTVLFESDARSQSRMFGRLLEAPKDE